MRPTVCVVVALATLVAAVLSSSPVPEHDKLLEEVRAVQAQARATGWLDTAKLAAIHNAVNSLHDALQEEEKEDKQVVQARVTELEASRRASAASLQEVTAQLARLETEQANFEALIATNRKHLEEAEGELARAQAMINQARTSTPELVRALRAKHDAVDAALTTLSSATIGALPSSVRGLASDLVLGLDSYNALDSYLEAQLETALSDEEQRFRDTQAALSTTIAALNTEYARLSSLAEGTSLDIEKQQALLSALTSTTDSYTHMIASFQAAFDKRQAEREQEKGTLQSIRAIAEATLHEFANADKDDYSNPQGSAPPNTATITSQLFMPSPILLTAFSTHLARPFSDAIEAVLRATLSLDDEAFVRVVVVSASRVAAEDAAETVELVQSSVHVVSEGGESGPDSLLVTMKTTVDRGLGDAVLGVWTPELLGEAAARVPALLLAGPITPTHSPVLTRGEVVLNCPGNCSGPRGRCLPSGFCDCYADWTGEDCSRPQCLAGCLHGQCTSPGVCKCQPGYIGKSCNTPVRCSRPVPAQHQLVTCQGDNVGDLCAYSCLDGYKLTNASWSERVCETNGQWTGSAPYCAPVECPMPPRLPNGFVKCTGFTLGANCTHHCAVGYTLASAPPTPVTCLSSGHWSTEVVPVCRRDVCEGDPPVPANASLRCVGSGVGAICDQTCNIGFQRPRFPRPGQPADSDTPSQFVCTEQLNGDNRRELQWKGSPIECVPVVCDEPSAPSHGDVACSGRRVGDTCEFKCDADYHLHLPDMANATCMSNGQWSSPHALCVPVHCVPPNSTRIHNGDYKCSGTTLGSACEISCDPGFALATAVPSTRVCEADGTWSGEEVHDVRCERLACSPPEIDGGVVSCSGNGVGDVCSVACQPGRMLDASSSAAAVFSGSHEPSPELSICTPDGWDPPLPFCPLMLCDGLAHPDPDVGSLSCTQGDAHHGDHCTLRCNAGYRVDGHSDVVCVRGVWDKALGVCEEVDCGAPPLANGASPECDGNRCEYTCLERPTDVPASVTLALRDGEEVEVEVVEGQGVVVLCELPATAQEEGEWSVDTASGDLSPLALDSNHVIADDSPLSSPTPGRLFSAFAFATTDSAPDGVELQFRFTPADDSAAQPRSRAVRVKVVARDSVTRSFALACGERDGEWTGEVPDTCRGLRMALADTPKLANGHVQCGTDSDGVQTCVYACDEGHVLEGPSTRRFVNAQLTGPAPRCVSHHCPPLPRAANVLTNVCSGNKLGDTCRPQCRYGFRQSRTNDGIEQRCEEDGWSLHTHACDKPVTCPPLELSSQDAYGECEQGSAQRAGTRCRVMCRPGFLGTFSSTNAAVCLDSGEWDLPSFSCEASLCSEPDRPANGNVSFTGLQASSTASFFCDAGYTLTGSKHLNCLPGGVWSEPMPQCTRVLCVAPMLPSNVARIECSGEPGVGQTCRMQCSEGHTLTVNGVSRPSGVALEESVCGMDGEWSGGDVGCVPNTCDPWTTTDPHLRISCSGHSYLSHCAAYCDDGFVLVGSRERVCGQDSRWTGQAPICVAASCGALAAPARGSVECDGQRPGEACRYACERGFRLVGSKERRCGVSGLWSGSAPRCAPVDCGSPPAVPNGQVTCDNGTAHGATCTFACLVGHTLEGSHTRTCQANGVWSGASPVCSRLDCGPLSPSPNSHMHCTGTTMSHHCISVCNEGYDLAGGYSDRSCQSTGMWSGTPPVCRRRQCPAASIGEGVEASCIGSTGDDGAGGSPRSVGAVCHFSCARGRRLVGPSVRTCEHSGVWSGIAPRCEVVDCGLPSVPADTGAPDCTGTHFNSTCHMQCSSDPNELTTLTCRGNGQWAHTSGPSCRYASCAAPSLPEGMSHDCDEGKWVGGMCSVFCNETEGFVRHSPWLSHRHTSPSHSHGVLVCAATGQWTTVIPLHCAQPFCEPLAPIANGRRDCTGHGINDTCTITCRAGYNLVPVVAQDGRHGNRTSQTSQASANAVGKRVCSASAVVGSAIGQWVGMEGKCVPAVCERPQVPLNARMRCTGSNYADMCYFDCDPLTLVDNTTSAQRSLSLFCNAIGTFSSSPPECSPLTCPALPSSHGTAACELSGPAKRSKRDVCPMVCDDGEVGGGAFMCAAGGWAGHSIPCTAVDCGEPSSPPNGQYVCNGHTFGSECTLQCTNTSFFPFSPFPDPLSSPHTLACSKEGVWVGVPSFCLAFQCPRLRDAPHSSVECTGDGGVGTVCEWTCDSGYELVRGSPRRRCEEGGTWSGYSQPVCEALACDDISGISGALVTICAGSAHGDECTLSCAEGYTLQGAPTRRCQQGIWSASDAVCKPTECTPPDSPAFSDVSCSALPHFLDRCDISCIPGYRMQPSAFENRTSHVCLSDGSWSNHAYGRDIQCDQVLCPPLPRVPGVWMQCDGDDRGVPAGGQCVTRCEAGFHAREGSVTHQCSNQGLWSPYRTLECVPDKCREYEGFPNAVWDCTGSSHLDVCSVTCASGYDMYQTLSLWGSASLLEVDEGSGFFSPERLQSTHATCENGRWSFNGEYCSRRKCEAPAAIAHGHLQCDGEAVGAQCEVVCDTGMVHAGPRVKTCTPSAQWESQDEITCTPVDCGNPPMPSNATFETFTTTYGSLVTVECLEGFELRGSQTRACSASGVWTGVPATCEPIDCGKPADPATGSVRCEGSKFGHLCTYECLQPADATHLQPSIVHRQAVCGLDRQWQPLSDLAPCVVDACPSLPQPAHGRMVCDDDTCHSFVCNRGYELTSSSAVLECKDGAWKGAYPVCSPVSCPEPSLPQRAKITWHSHQRLTVTCDEGFRLPFDHSRTAYTRVCTSDGEWSGDGISECVPVDCGAPSPLLVSPDGDLVAPTHPDAPIASLPRGSTTYGDIVLYQCPLGHTLEGPSSRMCTAKGTWDASAAVCKRRQCGPLPTLDNGVLVATRDTEGTTAFPFGTRMDLKCPTGSRLRGVRVIECTSAGAWTKPIAACTPVNCGRPATVANSILECAGTLLGDTCTYTCVGTANVTTRTITCGTDGRWNGGLPTCSVPSCASPLLPPHAHAVCPDGHRLHSRCGVRCERGFQFVNRKGVAVQSPAISCSDAPSFPQWVGSGVEGVCTPLECPPLNLPPSVIKRCTRHYRAHCEFECPAGRVLVGAVAASCQANGEWSAQPPSCAAITCSAPLPPSHATTTVSSASHSPLSSPLSLSPALPLPSSLPRFEVGDEAVVQCDSGYNMLSISPSGVVELVESNQVTRQCTPRAVWSGAAVVCVADQCEDPVAPAHGTVSLFDASLRVGTLAVYECEAGYKLTTDRERLCVLESGRARWRGAEPSCQPVRCPQLPSVPHTDIVCSHGGAVGSATFRSECHFSCQEGHFLASPLHTLLHTCTGSGEWAGELPQCDPVHCHAPPVDVGTIDCPNGASFNESCVMTCPPHHHVRGRALGSSWARLVCTSSGTFDVQPSCERTSCPELEAPAHGRVVVHHGKRGDHDADTAAVVCDTGFTPSSQSVVTCGRNRTWSGTLPSCNIAHCGSPLRLREGVTANCSSPDHVFGDSCVFACAGDGTDLSLTNAQQGLSAECTAKAAWSRAPPTCKPVDCGPPIVEPWTHTRATCKATTLGHTCEYSCTQGALKSGDATRVCQPDRSWSGVPPVCELEAEVANLAQGRPALQSSTKFGAAASIALTPHHNLQGWPNCSRTFQQDNPWWEVIIGGPHLIRTVEVSLALGSQAMHPLFILLSNSTTPPALVHGELSLDGVVCARGALLDVGTTKNFTCGDVVAAHVFVGVEGEGKVLELCGVRVFGSVLREEEEEEKDAKGVNALWASGTKQQQSSDGSRGAMGSERCVVTNEEEDPWWVLDMGVSREVGEVVFDTPLSSGATLQYEVRVGASALEHGRGNPACSPPVVVSTTTGVKHRVRCNGLRGRFVSVLAKGNQTLMLCDLSVRVEQAAVASLVDLAQFKKLEWSPSALVVGAGGGDPACPQSAVADSPSILIDLQASVVVERVVVRMGALASPLLGVRVAEDQGNLAASALCATPRSAAAHSVFAEGCGVRGRYVHVVAHGWNQVLSLCDVEVWASLE